MAKSATHSNRKFSVAGTSILNGVRTFRFANGDLDARESALRYAGHTSIKLEELPTRMNKVNAMSYLMTRGKGVRAVLPTRSPDKRRKSPIQIEAEVLAASGKGRSKKAPTEATA